MSGGPQTPSPAPHTESRANSNRLAQSAYADAKRALEAMT
jgi:hypothetical protein